VYYTNRLHSALGEFERKYLVEELGFPLCDTSVRGPLTIPRFHISVEEKVAAAAEAYREWEKEMEEGGEKASKRFETGTIDDDDDDVCRSGGGRKTKNSMHASGNIKGKSIRDGSSSKGTRISTPGVLCSGVEIGRCRHSSFLACILLCTTFPLFSRADRCSAPATNTAN